MTNRFIAGPLTHKEPHFGKQKFPQNCSEGIFVDNLTHSYFKNFCENKKSCIFAKLELAEPLNNA